MVEVMSNDRIVYAGRTGSGKSTHAEKYIEKNFRRYVIYDMEWRYSDFGFVVHRPEEFWNACKENPRIVFQPNDPVSVGMFDTICGVVMDKMSNMLFVADEVHNYATKYFIPVNYARIILQGRKRGIGSIAITQRPALLNTTVKTQAENLIIFNVHPHDAETFKHFIGDIWQDIPKLPQYNYIIYSIRDQKIRFYDDKGQCYRE